MSGCGQGGAECGTGVGGIGQNLQGTAVGVEQVGSDGGLMMADPIGRNFVLPRRKQEALDKRGYELIAYVPAEEG
ncbi:hypothetical protein ACIBI9_40070 [Nonomuraea sp. NPDC050451]|uniref:hypothetical protein n=1 Tax=Nonomuraea sp. NPDC050451 TaxID=3364364 RepID=UPI0037B73724